VREALGLGGRAVVHPWEQVEVEVHEQHQMLTFRRILGARLESVSWFVDHPTRAFSTRKAIHRMFTAG
jgi:hypothetical protein